MTFEQMQQLALEEVLRLTEADCKPEITELVPELLKRHQRASVWATTTVYAFGDVVQLEARNGHRYRCVAAGMSGAASPTWSTRSFARVADGTVVWEEDGPDYSNVFDVRAAAHEGWMQKAAMTVQETDYGVDDLKESRSQMHRHCLEMAQRYLPMGIS